MKRWILLILVFFVFGIWVFEQIQLDAGYLLISLNGLTLETSFWFAVFVVITGILAAFVFLYAVRKLFSIVGNGSSWFSGRRLQNIERHYREGLLHFLTGNWHEAHKQLSAVSRRNDLPVIRAIVAAQSAAHMGDATKALKLLTDAGSKYSDDELWLLKAQVPILIAENKLIDAEVNVARLKEIAPTDVTVESLELKLLISKQQWHAATDLLPQLQKHKALSPIEGHSLAVNSYLSAMHEMALSSHIDEQQLAVFWDKVPKSFKSDPKVIVAYARLLLNSDQHQLLEELISFKLEKQWLPELVDMYAKIESSDVSLQLKKAERWHKSHTDSAELLLTLGVLAVKNQLWGKARNYLEQACAKSDSSQALYLLGLIAEKLGDEDESKEYYKRAAGVNRLPALE